MIRYVPREADDTVNVSPRSPLREAAVLLGGLTGTVLALYVAAGVLVDVVAQRMSPSFERAVGGSIAAGLAPQRLSDARAAQVQAVLDDLSAVAPETGLSYTVHLVSAAAANAVALPGGHIVVYAPLLGYVTSENALAFVLAHELGHFVHRDHLRGAGRALVAAAEKSPRRAHLFATHPFPADRVRRLKDETLRRGYGERPVTPLPWDATVIRRRCADDREIPCVRRVPGSMGVRDGVPHRHRGNT